MFSSNKIRNPIQMELMQLYDIYIYFFNRNAFLLIYVKCGKTE